MILLALAKLDNQYLLYGAAAVVILVTFVGLILVPALSSYGRIWEKAAADLARLPYGDTDYAGAMTAIREMSVREAKHGKPVTTVSAAVRHALLSPRPRARYPLDPTKMQAPAKLIAQASRGADAVFIPEGPEVVPLVVQAMIAAGLDTKRVQLLGTGLWDDARIFNDARLHVPLVIRPTTRRARVRRARARVRG